MTNHRQNFAAAAAAIIAMHNGTGGEGGAPKPAAKAAPGNKPAGKKIAQPKPGSKAAQLQALREAKAAKADQPPQEAAGASKPAKAPRPAQAKKTRQRAATEDQGPKAAKAPPSVPAADTTAATPAAGSTDYVEQVKSNGASGGDPGDLPAFLKRPPMTDEERKELDMKAKTMNERAPRTPKREVKNPPSESRHKATSSPRRLPRTAATGKKKNGASKLALIVELLQRPQGCTAAEVLKLTGWPSVSMPQQARAAGLTLVKEKRDGVTHYTVKKSK